MTKAPPAESDLLTLAFSIHSNPGAYALLLGAGVSVSSGIPTAWGVLVDLTSRLALLEGMEPEDSIAWYEENFGEPVRYETLLKRLAPTKLERQRLLKSYFEPPTDGSATSSRGPTAAHRAIARLVKAGSVRVVMTLNFDRLVERALRDEGVEPVVISSAADVQGMAPLHTIEACVIHLHGDYLNPSSMLNTEEELHTYGESTARLLQRVLEDYGLVIGGWSSRYDPALRAAIAAHYSTRFTLFWLEPGVASDLASDLLALKKGVLVATHADSGFGRLADAVSALGRRSSRHPLSVPVAIETAKRDLSGEQVSIALHDALANELAALRENPDFHLPDYQSDEQYGGYAEMVTRITDATRVPAALIATLAYWGNPATDAWWLRELQRFAVSARGGGLTKLLNLRMVAGSVLYMAAGVGASAGRRYDLLSKLLTLRRDTAHGEEHDLLADVLEAKTERMDVRAVLWPILSDVIGSGNEPLEQAWQEFEVLRAASLVTSAPLFAALEHDLTIARGHLDTADEVFRAAQAGSGAVEAARKNRASAWENAGKASGRLAQLVGHVRPHVLVQDVRGDKGYLSPIAARLARDLRSEGSLHPVAAGGLTRDPDAYANALDAVSLAWGMVGRDLAWSRVRERVGVVPSEVWLDTGLTPDEIPNQVGSVTTDTPRDTRSE